MEVVALLASARVFVWNRGKNKKDREAKKGIPEIVPSVRPAIMFLPSSVFGSRQNSQCFKLVETDLYDGNRGEELLSCLTTYRQQMFKSDLPIPVDEIFCVVGNMPMSQKYHGKASKTACHIMRGDLLHDADYLPYLWNEYK